MCRKRLQLFKETQISPISKTILRIRLVDHKSLFDYFSRTTSTIICEKIVKSYRASWLGFPFENTLKRHLADILHLFDDRLHSIFPLCFRCMYFLLHFLQSQNWWQGQFQYLNYQKNLLLPLPGIYLSVLHTIYFKHYRNKIWIFFHKLFAVLIWLIVLLQNHQQKILE